MTDYKRYGDRGLVRNAAGTPVEIGAYRSPGWEQESVILDRPPSYTEKLERMIKSRVRIRKHGGDDYMSWAVFVDDRPVYKGLDKFEAEYYKELEIQKLLNKVVGPKDIEVVKAARSEFLKKRALLERMKGAERRRGKKR